MFIANNMKEVVELYHKEKWKQQYDLTSIKPQPCFISRPIPYIMANFLLNKKRCVKCGKLKRPYGGPYYVDLYLDMNFFTVYEGLKIEMLGFTHCTNHECEYISPKFTVTITA
jgi:hypothetical protein